jgi:hypothetical protein
MKNELFNRNTKVAKLDSAVGSTNRNDELFRQEINVARISNERGETDLIVSNLQEVILESATNPKRVQGDAGSVEQHSLQDLIAAARFLESKKAMQGRGLGLRFTKLSPDGTV